MTDIKHLIRHQVARAKKRDGGRYADGGAAFGTLTPQEEAEVPPNFLDRAVSHGLGSLATLPKRAIDASAQDVQHLGDPDYQRQSIGPALETAMTMTGGAGVVPAEANTLRAGIKAYHGSPHDFDRFDASKIGTGEGAQSYGHGLYFAENEGVARGYRNKLSDTPSTAKFYLDRASGDPSKAAQEYWADIIRGPNLTSAEMEEAKRTASIIQRGGAGRMYKVDINADPAHMLDWDKPLHGQGIWEKLHPNVRNAIDETMDNRMMNPMSDALEAYTGRDLHSALRHEDVHEVLPAEIGNSSWYTGNTTEKRHTAEYLKSLEVPGIKYLDQGSRSAGDGSRNYVMFNDKLIDILRKYGITGAAATGMASEIMNHGEQHFASGGRVGDAEKPPFDPTAPFTTTAPQTASPDAPAKPPFDPSAPFTTSAPLPDVGPPAITAGQQQFSPGVPAVNEEVDRIARSANKNLIEPITHPIDTLTGIGRLGAGVAQYAGAPGEEYKADVDALVADYKKTYGSMEGFKNALVEDPVRVGLDASMGMGALRGLGRRAGVLPRPAPRVEVPTTQELHDASQGHYGAVHGLGVEMRPGFGHDIADNILNELHAESYRDYLAPKTFSAIEELRTPAGQNVGTQDLEGVRRLLNRVAADPIERDAARRAIGQIDDALVNLDPADAVVNAHFAPRVAEEATRARGDYAAYKQAQQIEEATDRASLQAASTGSGANIDNATRQKFRAILTNPKKARGYSREELAEMRQLVEGTAGANAARFVGKLAPSGIVSGGLSAALGHAIGHTAGVPIVGYVAKQLADAATARAATRLSEQRRLRSPEARRIGAVATPPVLPRVAIGVPRAMAQYGRLSNQYGPAASNPYAP